jgi:hypothetical protein
MDKQIEALLLNYKEVTGQKKELTSDEIKKFEAVCFGKVSNQLYKLFPGEVITIESINPLNGKVIFVDSYGRNTASLMNLGYRLVETERRFKYIPGSTLFERVNL